MGILDDAIRQHLDLKRRLGADDDELQRLEDEAFGPPSRPGDPDFPESDAAGESSASEPTAAEGVAVSERPAESPTSEPAVPEAEDSEAGSKDEDGAPFYDQSEEELDLELELEFEDEPEVTPAPPSANEPPIESLDTVEHPQEEAVHEPGESAAAEEQADSRQDADETADQSEEEVLEGELVEDEVADEGEGERAGDEDMLEETPEFLRDAPEDDELWFEQGRPKDFDF
jgi:hypothetical protein